MTKIMFSEALNEEDGIRNWSGVLKLQRPLNYKLKDLSYDLLYYDKDREHEGIFPLSIVPSVKKRRIILNQVFHGEFKTYWLVHIKDGVWHFVKEVEPYDW